MAGVTEPHIVVVDGSNLATEGRTTPSLRQLDEAVRAYAEEDPTAQIVVVVDATFEHRIDRSEREQFEQAELHGEIVSPPAGAIGRGDAFVLRIAERTHAAVLSNDSFQEFHAEHPWLFEEGRLIGGKPVPGVGWIFTPRTPVRGPKSRQATSKARRQSETEPLPAPAKAAELAKAARKAAARRATMISGAPPKVGDVWPGGATTSVGDTNGTATAVDDTPVPASVPPAATTGPKKAKKTAKKAVKKAAKKPKAAEKASEPIEAVPATEDVSTGGPVKKSTPKATKKATKKVTKATKKAATSATTTSNSAGEKAEGDVEEGEAATPRKAAKTGAPKAAKSVKAAKKTAKKPTKKAAKQKAATPSEADTVGPAGGGVVEVPATAASRTRTPAATKTTRSPAGDQAERAPETEDGRPIGGLPRVAARNQLVEAIGAATAEVLAPPEPDGMPAKGKGGKGSAAKDHPKEKEKGKSKRRRRAAPPPAVNEPLPFITFVATYPVGSEVQGEVASFTSHGAMVEVATADGGTLFCYIPLSGMGDPPPRKAREVLTRGQRRTFRLVSLDPTRRVAELALPELASSGASAG